MAPGVLFFCSSCSARFLTDCTGCDGAGVVSFSPNTGCTVLLGQARGGGWGLVSDKEELLEKAAEASRVCGQRARLLVWPSVVASHPQWTYLCRGNQPTRLQVLLALVFRKE